MTISALERGANLILDYVKTLENGSGVYRMLGENGQVLYVGKAKNLKKRVISYTLTHKLPIRLQRMVSETMSMEFILTHTEGEALLLESNLIKKLDPKYNILLKDDKTFPMIMVNTNHDFPLVSKYRGKPNKEDEFFGPFASTESVNATLEILQRTFGVRSCSDNDFATRKRPCLLYHIKRCSAPCVGKISKTEYEKNLDEMRAFLKGQGRDLQKDYAALMEEASVTLNFERAAVLRDRIKALSQIQMIQNVNIQDIKDIDVWGIFKSRNHVCVQLFFFRNGCNYGNISYFPNITQDISEVEILEGFMGQFYSENPPPPKIICGFSSPELEELSLILTELYGKRVEIKKPHRGNLIPLLEQANHNAEKALERRLNEKASMIQIFKRLGEVFDLPSPPTRIEVYDNSHFQGSFPYGVMIVAGIDGFMKNAYRKFGIKGLPSSVKNIDCHPEGFSPKDPLPTTPYTNNDDYAMMREVFTRRFARSDDTWALPDLILVDGGKGQLSSALSVLKDYNLSIPIFGVGKGPNRNAGEETFYAPNKEPFTLPKNDGVLHFIQRIRDESHRFAIGTHRASRTKAIQKSPLDQMPGIGPKRKKLLLQHFGSGKAVSQAGIEDLKKVEGISEALAQKIYAFFKGI